MRPVRGLYTPFEKCWAIRHCEPFYIAIYQVSLLSHAACASMSTTTTTTTTRDRGDRYGPIEWAQQQKTIDIGPLLVSQTYTAVLSTKTRPVPFNIFHSLYISHSGQITPTDLALWYILIQHLLSVPRYLAYLLLNTATDRQEAEQRTCPYSPQNSAATAGNNIISILLAARRSGSVVRRMNEVTLHWARLVLGWVAVTGQVYQLGM